MEFIKKPVRVNAWRWTGEHNQNPKPEWLNDADFKIRRRKGKPIAEVKTHQGIVQANLGDWIILQSDGEVYPCNNKTFEESYESAGGVRLEEIERTKLARKLSSSESLLEGAKNTLRYMERHQEHLTEEYQKTLIEVTAYRNCHKARLLGDFEDANDDVMKEKAPCAKGMIGSIDMFLGDSHGGLGHRGSTSPFNGEAREHLDECSDRVMRSGRYPSGFADALAYMTSHNPMFDDIPFKTLK